MSPVFSLLLTASCFAFALCAMLYAHNPSPPDDQQRAPLTVLRRVLHPGPASLTIHQLDRLDKTGAQTARARRFPGIAVEQKCIIDHSQDLSTFREVHGPEQADLRLHLRQGQAECLSNGVQGAVDPAMGPIGEEAEAVLGRVDGKKSRFLFLEHVVVSPRGQEMGAELGSLGQDLDDPLHLREGNANLVRRAAAPLALCAAVAAVLERQKRLDVDFHAAALMMRLLLLTAIFRNIRSHRPQAEIGEIVGFFEEFILEQ
jgi:hypothetical protein